MINNNIKNKISNQYVVNNNVWCVDETYFSKNISLFLIINLKTKALLGFILKQNTNYEKFNNITVQIDDELICEIYEQLFKNHIVPDIIHSDSQPNYISNNVKDLCNNYNVQLSNTENKPKNNQSIEAVNNQIKILICEEILKLKRTKDSRLFIQSLPINLKNILNKNKAKNKEFRNLLFTSNYFQNSLNLVSIIKQAVSQYNNRLSNDYYLKKLNLTRQQLELYNAFIIVNKTTKATQGSIKASFINKKNANAFKDVKTQITKIKNNKELNKDQKLQQIDNVQVVQKDITVLDFINEFDGLGDTTFDKLFSFILFNTQILTSQNKLIYDQNVELKNILKDLKTENHDLKNINLENKVLLEELTEYKNKLLEEQKLKEQRRLKRANAKKRPKTQPILTEHYDAIISYIELNPSYSPLIKIRFKIMTFLLLLTGCRISEILSIKVDVIIYLHNSNSIPIDRKKGGAKQHKAFISKAGQTLLKARKQDFYFLLQYLGLTNITFKKSDIQTYNLNNRFLFQGQSIDAPLSRATFTLQYNKMLKEIPLFIEKDLQISSHSFRAGYITELWKKSGDIEFVRQVIGHSNIVSTVGYIDDLTDQQIEQKLYQIENNHNQNDSNQL
jgi:integrase